MKTSGPADTRTEARHRCRLTLTIDGVHYVVRPIPMTGGRRAYRLKKADGESHDVAQTEHGIICSCGDFIWRREYKDRHGCKHQRALVALGMI